MWTSMQPTRRHGIMIIIIIIIIIGDYQLAATLDDRFSSVSMLSPQSCEGNMKGVYCVEHCMHG